jgi:hypothetical protein
MKTLTLICTVLMLCLASTCAWGQPDTLYQEHFTNGTLSLNWFDAWATGPGITTLFVTGNPPGDGWVGKVGNDSSGGGVGTALAGTIGMTDYEIQAWIYCTVSSMAGGTYHAICARWDTLGPDSFYYLRTDFDTDQRLQLRLYDGSTTGITIATWTGAQIPGGVPTTSSWHRMALKCQGNQLWAWWDNVLLSGSPFTNNLLSHGFFGVYVFKLAGTAQTLCDDILVLGASSTPPVTVVLTPLNPPIVIPANGGNFSFNASLTRVTGPMAPYVVWTRIKNPNGTYTGNLLGPITINTPVGITITRTRNQNVPNTWASGVYSYLGYVNNTFAYPALDSSFFTFTKSAAADGGPSVWDAVCSGELFPGEAAVANPLAFNLIGAYPNPFNLSTVLSFKLQATNDVSLKVYDIAGQVVTTLVDSWQEAGVYQVKFDGSGLAAGVYLVRLTAGEISMVQKIVLLK